jgi:hypothetical protein
VIVPDRFSAERLEFLINGSSIKKIGHFMVEKKIPLTQSQKDFRCRSRKIRGTLVAPKSLPSTFKKGKGSHIRKGLKSCIIGRQLKTCFLTAHIKVNPFKSEDFVRTELDTQVWIRQLRTVAKELADRKEGLHLFCPSFFDPKPGSTGYKREEHFSKASFLVLDFDGGDVGPEDFVREFWPQASTITRHSFIICNSFSRSPDQPNRFRIIMFFKKPARTVTEYNSCFDYVERRLTKAGFAPSTSGMDSNSRSPAQSYYLPGTNRKFPDHAFFENYGTKTKELERYALDPHAINGSQRIKPIYVPFAAPSDFEMSERAQNMKAELASLSEGRHRKQYLFAIELRTLGATDMEIRQQLRECLGTESRMLKKIEGTIKSLNMPRPIVTNLAGGKEIRAEF